MELATLLFLLVILACPLMMVWMMRGHGGHGAHGSGHDHVRGPADEASGTRSLDALRRARADLDDQIERLERSDTETTTPA